MARALKASIDPEALSHNLQVVRRLAPQSKIIAMVKANGYGHDIKTVARALHSADAFGVACLEEALELRALGTQQRILLMEGFFEAKELSDIINYDLEPVIHHKEQIALLNNQSLDPFLTQSLKKSLKLWIKLNSGMGRLGFGVDEFKTAYTELSKRQNCEIQGIITHFACADEVDNQKTQQQIKVFDAATKGIQLPKSLANSAGILAWPETHQAWVRPGIMLYGVSPFRDRLGCDLDLKSAMTLSSELIAIQDLQRGDTVGYGAIFECDEPMRVGIVACGYADGYPRFAPQGTPVLVNGKQVPIIGRISMDMLTVDLRSQPAAKVSNPVELWGPNLPVEKVATRMGTIGYELLTGLSQRVPLINTRD